MEGNVWGLSKLGILDGVLVIKDESWGYFDLLEFQKKERKEIGAIMWWKVKIIYLIRV